MNGSVNQDRRASDILFDDLAGSRNSIRRENIRVIKEVCDLMEKDGVPIAAAEVVRRCGPNGPAYSTVCNTGSKLGEYIRLRVDEQASRTQDNIAGQLQPISDALSRTPIMGAPPPAWVKADLLNGYASAKGDCAKILAMKKSKIMYLD